MKLVKMSLVAAVVMGANLFAIDNIKVSGDAKLFYSTDNLDKPAGTSSDGLFGQANSVADTALRLNVTGDLLKDVSFGVTGYAVSSLGLESNLVSNTWAGSREGFEDAAWIGELWLAGTAGKTTVKAGRMELDTPLVFSEKWSTVPNTFNALMLMNTDIPDTTLVGAWVGQGNGLNTGGVKNDNGFGWDYMGNDFGTFASSGAYVAGVINNSFKPLIAQGWYYNVSDIADAYWLQADWDCQLIDGVKVGAQYSKMDTKGSVSAENDSSAYAVKVAYSGVKDLTLAAAYSSADEDNGALNIANVATANNPGSTGYSGKFAAQTKLYTEAWWNFGYVGTPGADSVMLSAAYDAGFAQFLAQFTDINIQAAGATDTYDVTELTLTATKTFGPLSASLAYISADDDGINDGKRYDTVQGYFVLSF
jgi:imipenem/basic amino acid-specific outer membrane pore